MQTDKCVYVEYTNQLSCNKFPIDVVDGTLHWANPAVSLVYCNATTSLHLLRADLWFWLGALSSSRAMPFFHRITSDLSYTFIGMYRT